MSSTTNRADAAVPGFGWALYILLTWFAWGTYGHSIQAATGGFKGNHFAPLIGVGIAYFATAVLVPLAVLLMLKRLGRDEGGGFTRQGVIRSATGGVLGAVGAVCLVLALVDGPGASFTMPLVFCCVPVVSTVYQLKKDPPTSESWPTARKRLFFVGLLLLILFILAVLRAKSSLAVAAPGAHGGEEHGHRHLLWTLGVIMSWGFYVPIMHQGTLAMQGKNGLAKGMRTLMMVGSAYFPITVLVPVGLILLGGEPVEITETGVVWSLVGGALGCLGAVGIIFGNNSAPGGPLTVAPLVFGGAPAVNTVAFFLIVSSRRGWELPDFSSFTPLIAAVLLGIVAVVLILKNKPLPRPKK